MECRHEPPGRAVIPALAGPVAADAADAGAGAPAIDGAVREHVLDWLRDRGRERGHLLDAIVFLDQAGGAISAKILLRTREGVFQPIHIDRTFTAGEIGSDLRRQLALAGRAQQHVWVDQDVVTR